MFKMILSFINIKKLILNLNINLKKSGKLQIKLQIKCIYMSLMI